MISHCGALRNDKRRVVRVLYQNAKQKATRTGGFLFGK
jgi:hypothetical protein